MGRPYERIVDIVSDGTAFYEMDFPSRVGISKIRITGLKGGAFNAAVYNKAFTGLAVPLFGVSSLDGACALLTFQTPHGLTVGDTCTVASSSVPAYNVAHVVTAVPDPCNVVTDQAFVGGSQGGTGTMSVPSTRYGNYEFQATKAADSDHVWRYDEPHGTPYVCHDPPTSFRQAQKIYFNFSVADTYRVTVMSLSDWYG
jgi:hypothetical protein